MQAESFDRWLSGLDLGFWGTAQHKVTPGKFFEQMRSEGAVLLDLRSPAEIDYLQVPFALHIPIDELPARWTEVPTNGLVAAFCSSGMRSAIAYAYL
jgi:rhodanese-related sulfurtransferase